jgi:hypothetical protein
VSGLNAYDQLVFELSSPGRVGFSLPESDVPARPLTELVPEKYLRGAAAALPEVSEFDVVRHYSRLSRMNYGVDTHFYPLGSCTMKYNPKLNEDMARLPGFARLHPLVRDEDTQGALQLMYDLAAMLAEIAGMDAVSLQPAAGAQGEFAGVLMIRAYHHSRGEKRTNRQTSWLSSRPPKRWLTLSSHHGLPTCAWCSPSWNGSPPTCSTQPKRLPRWGCLSGSRPSATCASAPYMPWPSGRALGSNPALSPMAG